MFPALALLLALSPAAGQEAPDGAPEPTTEAFGEVLQRARTVYSEGGHAEALSLLDGLAERLAQGEPVEPDEAADALIYLGEIQFVTGETAAAWETFKTLLERDPTRRISPYYHPTDVIGWFEMVRRQVLMETPPPDPGPPDPVPEEPPPPPLALYAPFGVPQFRQGRPAAGTAHLVGQVGLLAASFSTFVWVDSLNEWDDEQDEEWLKGRVNTARWLVQWPVTIAFYGLWGASHADARARWRRMQDAEAVSVGLSPTNDGATFVLSGSF